MPTLANGPAVLLPGHPLTVAIASAVLLCHPFASDWLGRNRWAAGDAGEHREGLAGSDPGTSWADSNRRHTALGRCSASELHTHARFTGPRNPVTLAPSGSAPHSVLPDTTKSVQAFHLLVLVSAPDRVFSSPDQVGLTLTASRQAGCCSPTTTLGPAHQGPP